MTIEEFHEQTGQPREDLRSRPMTIGEFREHTGQQREDFRESLQRYLLPPQAARRVALWERLVLLLLLSLCLTSS